MKNLLTIGLFLAALPILFLNAELAQAQEVIIGESMAYDLNGQPVDFTIETFTFRSDGSQGIETENFDFTALTVDSSETFQTVAQTSTTTADTTTYSDTSTASASPAPAGVTYTTDTTGTSAIGY